MALVVQWPTSTAEVRYFWPIASQDCNPYAGASKEDTMSRFQKIKQAREKVAARKLVHQHFQIRKNPPVAGTVSCFTRRAA